MQTNSATLDKKGKLTLKYSLKQFPEHWSNIEAVFLSNKDAIQKAYPNISFDYLSRSVAAVSTALGCQTEDYICISWDNPEEPCYIHIDYQPSYHS